MTVTELADLSIGEIVAATLSGEASPRAVVDSCLARVEKLDPTIQAWVRVDRDGALAQADEIGKRLERGERPPLAGVPLAVKDIIDVSGLPTVAGFAPFKDRVATSDAEIVARLRALGAIPLGKTHTTQFAFSDPAPTANPYNPAHTPGGSSSGSGAAVGARMVPLALGTQTAGSTLRPAAYCGAVGFKPTFNWMSRSGVIPLSWSLDHLGLIARDVSDVALVFQSLVGSPPNAVTGNDRPRIGILSDFLERAEPVISARARRAANQLGEAGASVEELRLPVDYDLIMSVHRVVMQPEVAAIHVEQLAKHRDDYGPVLANEVDVAELIPATFHLRAQRLRRKIRRELEQLLSRYDAWLLPTTADQPPLLSEDSTGDPSFQLPWTLLGTPSITLPAGLSELGLPIGLQLVGKRGQDSALLEVAAWVESVLGTIDPPALTGGTERGQR